MTVSLPPQSEHHAPSLQPSGWLRYFSFSVDHKVIGLQYLVCGFLFYLIGGALAGAIRTELVVLCRTSCPAMCTTRCSPCTAR